MSAMTQPKPSYWAQSSKDTYAPDRPAETLPAVSATTTKRWTEYSALLSQENLKAAGQKILAELVKLLGISDEQTGLHRLALNEADRLAAIVAQLPARELEQEKAFAKTPRMNVYSTIHDRQAQTFCRVQECFDFERQLESIKATFPLLFGVAPETVCSSEADCYLPAEIANALNETKP